MPGLEQTIDGNRKDRQADGEGKKADVGVLMSASYRNRKAVGHAAAEATHRCKQHERSVQRNTERNHKSGTKNISPIFERNNPQKKRTGASVHLRGRSFPPKLYAGKSITRLHREQDARANKKGRTRATTRPALIDKMELAKLFENAGRACGASSGYVSSVPTANARPAGPRYSACRMRPLSGGRHNKK